MSLLVWLPLNGDLQNQGLSALNFTNENTSTIMIDDNGKIGKCYKRAAKRTAGRIISDENINLSGDLSMCCWAKVIETPADSANGLITNHSHSDNTGFGITVKQISANDYRICCSTGNGSGRSYNIYYGTTNIKNAWHHLTLTYNSTTHIFQLWVDGKVEKTQSYTNASKADKIIIFDWSTTYNATAYRPACCLNDVRIYNHCLSAKEVEELSKGLVMHYKLDSKFEQPTVKNLIKNLVSGGQTTISNSTKIITSGINKDTYFQFDITEGLVEGEKYTIQCDVSSPLDNDTMVWQFGVTGQTTGINMPMYNGHNEFTWVCPTAAAGRTRIMMDDNGGRARANTAVTEIYNFQIEKSDHAGLLLPFNTTYTNEDILDSSGYLYHGRKSGIFNIIPDSPRYNNSLSLISTGYNTSGQTYNYIYAPLSLQSVTDITFAFWYKRSSSYNRGGFIALDTNTVFSNYTNSALNCFDSQADFYDVDGVRTRINGFPTSFLSDNQWHYYILEYSAGNKAKLYRDNIEIKNVNAGGVLKAFSYLGLNYSQAGGAKRGETCQFSDFRVYTTILTDQQKTELYNVSVAIDNNGDIYPRELVEK